MGGAYAGTARRDADRPLEPHAASRLPHRRGGTDGAAPGLACRSRAPGARRRARCGSAAACGARLCSSRPPHRPREPRSGSRGSPTRRARDRGDRRPRGPAAAARAAGGGERAERDRARGWRPDDLSMRRCRMADVLDASRPTSSSPGRRRRRDPPPPAAAGGHRHALDPRLDTMTGAALADGASVVVDDFASDERFGAASATITAHRHVRRRLLRDPAARPAVGHDLRVARAAARLHLGRPRSSWSRSRTSSAAASSGPSRSRRSVTRRCTTRSPGIPNRALLLDRLAAGARPGGTRPARSSACCTSTSTGSRT